MVENDHYNYTPYAYAYNNPILFIDVLGLDTTLHVIDQETNPNNKRVYTAETYMVDNNTGEINGPVASSSYPNAPDSENDHNTVKEGDLYYNNKSGHDGGAKKGLNIVDSEGSRQNTPGTDKDNTDVTMEWANFHPGQDLNAAGLHNRGSEGCFTTKPGADTETFMSWFDWSGSGGTTGNSSGNLSLFRGNATERAVRILTIKAKAFNTRQNIKKAAKIAEFNDLKLQK